MSHVADFNRAVQQFGQNWNLYEQMAERRRLQDEARAEKAAAEKAAQEEAQKLADYNQDIYGLATKGAERKRGASDYAEALGMSPTVYRHATQDDYLAAAAKHGLLKHDAVQKKFDSEARIDAANTRADQGQQRIDGAKDRHKDDMDFKNKGLEEKKKTSEERLKNERERIRIAWHNARTNRDRLSFYIKNYEAKAQIYDYLTLEQINGMIAEAEKELQSKKYGYSRDDSSIGVQGELSAKVAELKKLKEAKLRKMGSTKPGKPPPQPIAEDGYLDF